MMVDGLHNPAIGVCPMFITITDMITTLLTSSLKIAARSYYVWSKEDSDVVSSYFKETIMAEGASNQGRLPGTYIYNIVTTTIQSLV